MTPLADRLLVLPIITTRTDSLIVVPDSARKDQIQLGKVISIGADVRDIIPGSNIAFDKYSGSEIELDGVKHLLMHEDEALALVEME